MNNKFYIAVVSVFAFFQFIEIVHGKDSCSISYYEKGNRFNGECLFNWRDNMDCKKGADYIADKMSCDEIKGKECGYAGYGCYWGFGTFPSLCESIGGVQEKPKEGNCTILPKEHDIKKTRLLWSL